MPIRARGMTLLLALAIAVAPLRAVAGPALLFDVANAKVLYAENADQLWYPASLTKIMTAYIAFEAIKQGKLTLDSKLVSSEAASLEPPSKIGLPVGAEIAMDLGLRSLIIKSANDVAVMLAEAISGSKEAFAERMNATAIRLGMTRTHFVNPNGLPAEGQFTTARDLARLSIAVLRDFPEHAHYWSSPYVQIGKLKLRSHNSLLRRLEGADGLKTGFICDSGFNIVASATRDGRHLIAVVLGAPTARDRGIRAEGLLEHGFLTHDWKLYFSAATLDSMPSSTTSTEVTSIRNQVQGWSCGNRRAAARVIARKRRRAKLRRRKAAKPKTPRPATVTAPVKRPKLAAPAQPGPPKPAPKPKS